jgi:hypothetical protein
VEGFYARSPDVASRVVDGEAVLVKMPEGVLYVLNGSASRMWARADGVRGIEDVAEGVDLNEARTFLGGMAELGLLERTPSPRGAPEAFPQDIDLPPSREAPAIRASEPVETLAGGSCNFDEMACAPISVG